MPSLGGHHLDLQSTQCGSRPENACWHYGTSLISVLHLVVGGGKARLGQQNCSSTRSTLEKVQVAIVSGDLPRFCTKCRARWVVQDSQMIVCRRLFLDPSPLQRHPAALMSCDQHLTRQLTTNDVVLGVKQ